MRANFMKVIKPLGGYYGTAIVPRDGRWRVESRVLLKISPDYMLPETLEADPNVKLRRSERPSRKEIFKSVAHVCRYPTEWIRSDEVEQVILLLNTLRDGGYRMSANFGDFRRSSARAS